MNISFVALAGAVLLATCPWALAASSTDLSVKGSITPSACAPSLSSGGIVDYGKMATKDLQPGPGGMVDLPMRTLQMTVDCEAHTLFALTPIDNRTERPEPIQPWLYSLGVLEQKIMGVYMLDMTNILADSVSVSSLKSPDGGATWNLLAPGELWNPTTFTGFGNKSSGVLAPIPLQKLTMDVTVWPSLFPLDWLALTDSVELEGSTTLDLIYL